MKSFINILIIFTFLFAEQKILSGDGNEDDTFGHSVLMDSQWIVISANKAESNGVNSGSVYLYQNNNNSISNEIKIFPSDGEYNDYFGKSISLYEDWLAVSSIYDDENGYKSGSVYIFHYNGSTWQEFSKIIPEDGAPSDRFGYSLDIHSNFIAIGSIYDDDTGEDSGSVYIYKLNDTNEWEFNSKLYSNFSIDNNSFGGKLSLFNDYLAVSSKYTNSQYNEQGVVDIYKLTNNTWNYHQTIEAFDAGSYDYFGNSVDLNANSIAIGSYYDDDLNNNSGSVYIYKLQNENFHFTQKLLPDDGYANDNFGQSISIYNNWLAVGSMDDDNGINSGSAYIFGIDEDLYTQRIKISSSDGYNFDEFSNSLCIYDNYLLVGARNDDDLGIDSGSAYLYEYKGCSDEQACNYDNYLISDNTQCYFEENGFDCDGSCFEEIDLCGVCGGSGANGDANLDDVLNIIDIIIVVDFILYQTNLNSCIIDLNENEIINITDVILILESILND